MSTADERLTRVEQEIFETLPARIDDVADGITGLHADLRIFRRDVTRHFDRIDAEMLGIRSEIREMRGDMREILRRLPEPPAGE